MNGLRWMLMLLLIPAGLVCAESGYQPLAGEPFFILSDASFGSGDAARVRLEVPGRNLARAKLEAYGGVDIVVYKVPNPLVFLRAQKNLHRVDVQAVPQDEGLANTLKLLWHTWWSDSRRAWQALFRSEARQGVVEQAPALKLDPKALHTLPRFEHAPQYQPVKGLTLIERYRYPMWDAKAIAPPTTIKLTGSSSEFVQPAEGNVYIPLGKRAPGLYLIEALIGGHRAKTLVFVSDTVGITKVSSGQMLVWAADRVSGTAVSGVDVVWMDGTGVLKAAQTGRNGVAQMERSAPEKTYVAGQDAKGGVFISENFYYDSEIYNTKIYAVTDRPLYRAGDTVQIKLLGREFTSARESRAAAAGNVALTVIDPNGTPVAAQTAALDPERGADASVKLPDNAVAGGYEIAFTYRGDSYSAAFRVADYVKPHFEISLVPDKSSFKTGEPVTGKVQLSYPDGKPVRNAQVSLTVRMQQSTMVEAELAYAGQFPVKLEVEELQTDAKGAAAFTLPPAKEPSRYAITVLATDGAAYRVRATRELLVERGAGLVRLHAPRQVSAAGEMVEFALASVGPHADKPVRWDAVQLETQTKTGGDIAAGASRLGILFSASGSYTVMVRDAHGNVLGAAAHWVAGAGMKAAQGSIEMVFNQERYAPGDMAEALITFPEPVEEALFTLERDRVEAVSLMRAGSTWVSAERIAPAQWRAKLRVQEQHAPNMTFSVAYVKHGDYVFQNRGLVVDQPKIAVQFSTVKPVYQPGETVTVNMTSTLAGQPIPALIAVGVVDEMIYVLQPEVAPDVFDFFYHPRRNNVRTAASLSFISYDLAIARRANAPPARHTQNQRAVKVLERPRRDETDTAFWHGAIKTDAQGQASFTFTMPDSLTRWRMTARAMSAEGTVGQGVAYVRSDKPFYAKWSAPTWLREGDAPLAAVALFNSTQTEAALELVVTGISSPGRAAASGTSGNAGGSAPLMRKVSVKPGINFITLPVGRAASGQPVSVQLRKDGVLVDVLDTLLRRRPLAWQSPHTAAVTMAGASATLGLPADASNVRVSFSEGASAHFMRIADDLIDYPYGCVEQTASRIVPLSLALASMPAGSRANEDLRRMLATQRLRLTHMAGPNASFGWWGHATEANALMTTYAYYADWHASRTLGVALPEAHWMRLLEVYQKQGTAEPLATRALMLWLMGEMGLPVKTLTSGVADAFANSRTRGNSAAAAAWPYRHGALMSAPESGMGESIGLLLMADLAARHSLVLPPDVARAVHAAAAAVKSAPTPAGEALLVMTKRLPMKEAARVLATVRAEQPTLDRALALVWVQRALVGRLPPHPGPQPQLAAPWAAQTTASGRTLFRPAPGAPVPKTLVLEHLPARPVTALVQYDSSAKETHSLPVHIERRWYRLTASKAGGGKDAVFSAQLMRAGEPFATDGLYVDELVLQAEGAHRFGIAEVALPPGAAVESSTWGLNVGGFEGTQGKAEPMERVRHENAPYGYSVAIEPLRGSVTLRHLVRFGARGTFNLPPVRFYRMYQPEQKAFEGQSRPVARAVEVK